MKRTDAKRSHGVLPPIAVRRFMALVLALLMLVPADLASVLAEGTRSSGKKLICGLEEHQHNKACYEKTLICGEEERDPVKQTRRVYVGNLKPHKHTKKCYDKHGQLICGTVEKAYFHQHNKYCYDEAGKLVCGLKERLNDHEHTDKCYGRSRC